jgi:acetyl esterase/lipase
MRAPSYPSPLADLAYKGNSRRHNKRADPVLPTQRIAAMQELYIGESLPDNLVGSTEILLDDTLRAALQAGKADVPFYLEVWEKMPHVFPIFSILPESEVAIERIGKFIREGYLHPLPKRYGRHKATRREQRALALK